MREGRLVFPKGRSQGVPVDRSDRLRIKLWEGRAEIGEEPNDQCTKRKNRKREVIFARYAMKSRKVWAIAVAGWLAASTAMSADVVMSGSFLATKDCPAFQSFRKATNPGGIKIVPGHSYPLLAKNAPEASHYRVRIEGARAGRALGERRLWELQ